MKNIYLKLFAVLALVFSTAAFGWTQTPPAPAPTCIAQEPFGTPQTTKALTLICRHAYVTGYDAHAKIPAWTSYTLLPKNALGCVPRSNAFEADASVVNGATPADYIGAQKNKITYDKGHIADDGDMSFDNQAELESFLMTNMTPQDPGFNRGIWKLLETSVRGWAFQVNQPFTIYAGAIYNVAIDMKIGKNQVDVPTAFYKIVINDTTKEVAGWMFPNVGNQGNNLVPFRKPVADIQKISGITFAFPPGTVELAPGKEWPVNFGALTKSKKVKCGANAAID